MTTGFEPFANSTLVFSVSGNTTTVDPDTGNVIPSTSTETYVAFLAQMRPPQYLADDGIDTTTIYLEGQLINPWRFGVRVYPNSVAQATFDGITGTFELLPTEERLSAYKPWLGTQLRGWFKAFGPARSTP